MPALPQSRYLLVGRTSPLTQGTPQSRREPRTRLPRAEYPDSCYEIGTEQRGEYWLTHTRDNVLGKADCPKRSKRSWV